MAMRAIPGSIECTYSVDLEQVSEMTRQIHEAYSMLVNVLSDARRLEDSIQGFVD